MTTYRSQVTSVYLPSKSMNTLNRIPQTLTNVDYKPQRAVPRETKSEAYLQDTDDWFGEKSRNNKINQVIDECLISKTYKEFEDYFVLGTSFTPYAPISKTIYQMFEKILSLYNIEAYVVWNDIEDSATTIAPIQQDIDMYNCAGMLLKELRRFPLTLYKALDLRIITFCGTAKLVKQSYSNIFIKKYYNWLFMVNDMKSYEEIQRHFLNTVCYNLVTRTQGFNERWEKLNPAKSQKNVGRIVLPPGHVKPGYLNSKCSQNITMDQFEVFRALITRPKEIIGHQDRIVAQKGRLLMEALCKMDPEGLDDRWWADKGFMATEEEDDEEDLIFQNK